MNAFWAPGVTLEEMERLVIQEAMMVYRGEKNTISAALGIGRRTLDMKLEKYEADDLVRKEREEKLAEGRRKYAERARGIPDYARPANIAPAPMVDRPKEVAVKSESAPVVPAKPAVSLPERSKVQEMLFKKPETANTRRTRAQNP